LIRLKHRNEVCWLGLDLTASVSFLAHTFVWYDTAVVSVECMDEIVTSKCQLIECLFSLWRIAWGRDVSVNIDYQEISYVLK
jgi:hypothetical protein